MATPTLRLVRRRLPGCFIGGLVRPGIDEVLDGAGFFDEMHVARASGVMGPKFVAAKVRPRRYDTVLLLTNSFSTALVARIAGIPRRIGYARDARTLLLTDSLDPPKRPDGSWAPVPAVEYYLRLACEKLLDVPLPDWRRPPQPGLDPPAPLELAVTPAQAQAGRDLLQRCGVGLNEPIAVLNPGGNNEAKRWPAERFAAVAEHLATRYGLRVLLNGAPGEAELLDSIIASVRSRVGTGASRDAAPVSLAAHGVTLGALKEVLRRSRLMVTNDTGPRHIGAALGVNVVSLFGPTDHRWTTIPMRSGAREEVLLADPTLPETELANDHPERCRVDRISLETVLAAIDRLIKPGPAGPVSVPS